MGKIVMQTERFNLGMTKEKYSKSKQLLRLKMTLYNTLLIVEVRVNIWLHLFFFVSLFNGTSTFVDHLMPDLSVGFVEYTDCISAEV